MSAAVAAAASDGNGIREIFGRGKGRRSSHNSKTNNERRKQGECFRHDCLLW